MTDIPQDFVDLTKDLSRGLPIKILGLEDEDGHRFVVGLFAPDLVMIGVDNGEGEKGQSFILYNKAIDNLITILAEHRTEGKA